MTRKHFRMMAAEIAAMQDRTAARHMAESLAEMFAAANSRFDRSRFMTACNLFG